MFSPDVLVAASKYSILWSVEPCAYLLLDVLVAANKFSLL